MPASTSQIHFVSSLRQERSYLVAADKLAHREKEIIAEALAEQAQQIDLEAFPQILRDAAAERKRQVSKEGFGLPHDDQHVGGELALAAACYAIPAWFRFEFGGIFNLWPWHRTWWKPSATDRRRDIVKAIALLVAEDERLARLVAVKPTAVSNEVDNAKLMEPYLVPESPLLTYRGAKEQRSYFYHAPSLSSLKVPKHVGGLWDGRRVTRLTSPYELQRGVFEAFIETEA